MNGVDPSRDRAERFVANCRITGHREVASGQFRMRLDAPGMARVARPGQFCMIQVSGGFYPFLRRPMSFERIHEDGFSVLYKVEGEGTRLLSELQPGQSLSIQGPLGNGFPIEPGFKRHILVAGGIGVAPFPALAEALVKACGVRPEVVVAARTREMLVCVDDLREMGCVVHVATDDGSLGEKAYAPEMLSRLSPSSESRVYVCGPMVMIRAAARVALDAGADCLVSLEARMACGDGACLGCVVETEHAEEGKGMACVCLDGPVFDAREIAWNTRSTSHGL